MPAEPTLSLTLALGERTPVELASRQLLVLSNPGVYEVVCGRGTLWLTQEGDERDHFLAPGQAFTTSATGKIVIEAAEGRPAAVFVREAPSQQGSISRWGGLGIGGPVVFKNNLFYGKS